MKSKKMLAAALTVGCLAPVALAVGGGVVDAQQPHA